MEHAPHLDQPFPWRAATLVATSVALVELAVLAVGGTLLLAHPFRHHHGTTVASPVRTPVARQHQATAAAAARSPSHTRAHPALAPSRLHVLVLNGNGVQGAAASAASKLSSLGYRISGQANAARNDYARTLVMYRPGFAPEARRLAHSAGYALVSPVDGLTPSALRGSQLVVILGR